jgi:hypothetical protein
VWVVTTTHDHSITGRWLIYGFPHSRGYRRGPEGAEIDPQG